MKRLLKRILSPVLHPRLRSYFRERWQNELETAPVDRSWTLRGEGVKIRCTSDTGWSFLAPKECRDDLLYFTTTPWGKTEFSVLTNAAEQAQVAFDIGAHAGLVSALMCAVNPRVKVFSFEPSPILCRRLYEIAALNGFEARMSIENVGIGKTPGVLEMFIDPAGGFVQCQRFEHSMWAEPKAIQIRIETIEAASARLGVEPQLIKMDIEGFEYEAIEGSRGFLKRIRPKLLLEVHLNYLEERGLSAHALTDMLMECDYVAYSYSGRRLRPAQIYGSVLSNMHLVLQAAEGAEAEMSTVTGANRRTR